MDEELESNRSYLFTVRIWLEALGNGRAEWRGKVQYVSNGEACYFREWPALLAFIQKHASGETGQPGYEPGGKECFE